MKGWKRDFAVVGLTHRHRRRRRRRRSRLSLLSHYAAVQATALRARTLRLSAEHRSVNAGLKPVENQSRDFWRQTI